MARTMRSFSAFRPRSQMVPMKPSPVAMMAGEAGLRSLVFEGSPRETT